MRRVHLHLIALSTALAVSSGAWAQQYPERQITMLVGFAPGGGTDTTARIIAKRLSEVLGKPVIVDNRPGASGNIAQEMLVRSAPDGYTIMLGSLPSLAIAPHLVAKLPYDPFRDVQPIILAVAFPNVLVVHASVPANNLAEFVKLAKDKPGQISYGSSGIGGAGHLAGELFRAMAKVDIVHVPYKGGAPATTDLLAGQIAAIFAAPISVLPHIKSGKLRALATTGARRAANMPELPTIAESGYPGYEAVNWYGYIAPAKTPKAIIERLHKELFAILTEPPTREQIQSHGMETAPGTTEAFARYIRSEYEIWGKVIKEAGITAN
jgi:tripartite-type tricarboxylate transporter receptor subunit TctC